MAGTNFGALDGNSVRVYLTDESGNAILIRCTVALLPSGKTGYAVGCIAQTTDAGVIYKNSSATSSSFSTTLSS